MEILIFDTHRPLSAIIFPFKFTQRHSSQGCLFTLEKTCDVSVNKKQFSGNKNRFSVNQILKNKEKVK